MVCSEDQGLLQGVGVGSGIPEADATSWVALDQSFPEPPLSPFERPELLLFFSWRRGEDL